MKLIILSEVIIQHFPNCLYVSIHTHTHVCAFTPIYVYIDTYLNKQIFEWVDHTFYPTHYLNPKVITIEVQIQSTIDYDDKEKQVICKLFFFLNEKNLHRSLVSSFLFNSKQVIVFPLFCVFSFHHHPPPLYRKRIFFESYSDWL